MKKNKSTIIDDEIDIRNLVQNLWQHKILILSVSILSMLLVYIINLNTNGNNPNDVKLIIAIKKITKETLEPYQSMYDLSKSSISIDFYKEFNEQLISNFLDIDNIVTFLEESKDFDDFKLFLKSNKITSSSYFYNKNFGTENNNIDRNNLYFFLILPEKTGEDKFLYNYSNFIFGKTKIYMKNLINREIDNIIIQNENTLAKIETFNLADLFITPTKNQNEINPLTVLNFPSKKDLLQKISSLKELKFFSDNHLSNLNSKIHPVSNELFSRVDRPNPSNTNLLLGLILGFFLSLIIIFIRKVL